MFNNSTILVTGGTGSFGKRFIATILSRYLPKKIIVYSRDELKQYEMQQLDPFKKSKAVMRYFIGDVRDGKRMSFALEGVDFVVHAAAMKQVPAAEYNPFEAVKTNILGAENVIEAAMEKGVTKVIALSTDKAAAPINIYGATKLASDKLFIAANNYKGSRNIKFSVVRYGNVMGSRGSVIPFFLSQKPIGIYPVTDERMTRFNITLQEGVDFVINSFSTMWGGELFIPKIPSYKLLDVVKAIDPNGKVEIVGIRPGEKLHEEMITETDAINTIEFADYYVILPSMQNWSFEEFRKFSSKSEGKFLNAGFSYNSGNNPDFLNPEEIRALILSDVDGANELINHI